MKLIDSVKETVFYKPALAALLMAFSRLPFPFGWLVFFGFIPLFSFFGEGRNVKAQIKAGIVFAVVYTLVSLHWISLVTIGGFIGLFIIFSLYFFLLFILINSAWKRFPKMRLLAFLCFWMAFEYLQNFGEFSFPWFNVGYSLAEFLPFIQPAEIGGIYLISILIILVSFLLWKLQDDFRKSFMLLVLVVVIWSVFGYARLNNLKLQETGTKISLVQVSIPQSLKWEDNYRDSTISRYRKYTEIASVQNPDLIIWPESALPVYTLRNKKYRDLVKNLARENSADIFMGMPHYQFVGDAHPNRYEFYNSATRFGKDGTVDPYYVKNILVPFGERMPFLKYLPFLWNVHLGQANWEYGTKQEFYELNGYKYSPLICFEIAFEQLTTKMAKHNVDFIVNITNDAWFYRSAGTYQHAVMTKFRAVETRRSIFRCANTGYSMIVSPTGEVLKQSKLFEQTVISDNLILYDKNSFFTNYLSSYPFVFVIGAGMMMIWMLSGSIKKKRKINPAVPSGRD